MRESWITVLAACLALAAPAEAAELTGFGPIKFGMTRDEAFVAIGNKGTWHSNRELRYEVIYDSFLSEAIRKLRVTQEFENGRAAEVRVQVQVDKVPRFSCLAIASVFGGVISEKYGISPILRNDVWEHYRPTDFESDDTTDLFTFGFNHNAYIQMSATWSTKSAMCRIGLAYSPPLKSPIPF